MTDDDKTEMIKLAKPSLDKLRKRITIKNIKYPHMKNGRLLLLSCIVLLTFDSCYYDNFKELHPENALNNSNTCDTAGVISYTAQIVPVLNRSCNTQCHGGSGGGGGRDLTTYSLVLEEAASGRLVSSIIWDGNAQQMPQGATNKIPDCDIAKIKKWVAASAPNN